MEVSYQLKVLHCLHRVLNLYSLGLSQDLTNAFIHRAMRTSVNEFLGIINLMSSATIFTSAHIVILLLSLHVFILFCFFLPELILQLFSSLNTKNKQLLRWFSMLKKVDLFIYVYLFIFIFIYFLFFCCWTSLLIVFSGKIKRTLIVVMKQKIFDQ